MRRSAMRPPCDIAANQEIIGVLCLSFLLMAVSALAEPLPELPVRYEGACPFECCIYREWTAMDSIRVFREERDTSDVVFVLAPGEAFEAVTGNEYLLKYGLAIVTHPINEVWGDEIDALAPGDTIWLLSRGSEGIVPAWHGGHEFVAQHEWWVNALGWGKGEDVSRLVNWPETEWWVFVRCRNGQSGWIRADEAEVDGSDQCS